MIKQEEKIECCECESEYLKDYYWPPICPQCRMNDIDDARHTVQSSYRRKGGILPPDLTAEQWLKTLQYFNGMCAYCRKKGYEVLEHFVPMCLGGSTTISNVVPSCNLCNARKCNVHPALVTKIPGEDIERVREYLMSFL